MNEPVTILKEALLTEKATMLSANLNQYVFSVYPQATKTNVKNAIEQTFGVKVIKVVNVLGCWYIGMLLLLCFCCCCFLNLLLFYYHLPPPLLLFL